MEKFIFFEKNKKNLRSDENIGAYPQKSPAKLSPALGKIFVSKQK
jgi:hypothetical protein